MTSTTNYEKLQSWFEDPRNSSFLNTELCYVKKSPNGGLGVFASQDITIPEKEDQSEEDRDNDQEEYEEDEEDPDMGLILRVAKASVLSPKNSCIANLLEEQDLDGMTGLVIAYLYEKLAAEKSPWYGYLQTISYYDDDGSLRQPFGFWDEKELKLPIELSSASFYKEESKETLEQNYLSAIRFAQLHKDMLGVPEELRYAFDSKKFKDEKTYSPLFGAAFVAVTSRAFEVDDFHGLALVPGADLFNHLQGGAENVHFEALGEVCENCGKHGGCQHDEDIEGTEDENEQEGDTDDDDEHENDQRTSKEEDDVDDNMLESEDEHMDVDLEERPLVTEITDEFIEQIEAELQEEYAEGQDGEEYEEEESDLDEIEDEYGVFSAKEIVTDPLECCDIKLFKSVKKDEELFNTYGELSPAQLLARYGFSIPSHSGADIYFHDEVEQLGKEKSRLQWWIEKGRMSFFKYYYSGSHKSDATPDIVGLDPEEFISNKTLRLFYEEYDWRKRVFYNKTTGPSPEFLVLCYIMTCHPSKFFKKGDTSTPAEKLIFASFNTPSTYKIVNELFATKRSRYTAAIKGMKTTGKEGFLKMMLQQELKDISRDISTSKRRN